MRREFLLLAAALILTAPVFAASVGGAGAGGAHSGVAGGTAHGGLGGLSARTAAGSTHRAAGVRAANASATRGVGAVRSVHVQPDTEHHDHRPHEYPVREPGWAYGSVCFSDADAMVTACNTMPTKTRPDGRG
jgi:hypothetical protein